MRFVRLVLRLRLRLLLASLKSRKRSDGFESVSRALGVVVPIFVGLGLSVLVVGAGIAGGFLASLWVVHPGSRPTLAVVFALGLTVPLLLAALGPFFGGEVGVGIERSVFLRTLPVPRRSLDVIRLLDAAMRAPVLAAALALAAATGVLLVTAPGLAAGAVAAVASALFVVLLVALNGLSDLVAERLMRRRRLSAWVRLGAIFAFAVVASFGPLAGLYTPADLDIGRLLPVAVVVDPGAAWAVAVTAALGHHLGLAGAALGLLALVAVAALALSARMSRGLLESPPASHRGRSRRPAPPPGRIPLLRPATAAVARGHLRLVLRTTRGRLAILGPPLGATIFAVLERYGPAAGFISSAGPIFVAAIVLAGALGNLSAITGNQLAVLGEGLVLERLQPVDDASLLRGCAAGGGFAYGLTVLLGLGITFPILHPAPWIWIAAGLAGVVVYGALAPIQALASVIFPVTARLGTMSHRQGGPHPLARYGLLAGSGMLTGACFLLGWGGLALGGPVLAVVFVGAAAAAAAAAAGPLIGLAARTVPGRMENVLLVATGR